MIQESIEKNVNETDPESFVDVESELKDKNFHLMVS